MFFNVNLTSARQKPIMFSMYDENVGVFDEFLELNLKLLVKF